MIRHAVCTVSAAATLALTAAATLALTAAATLALTAAATLALTAAAARDCCDHPRSPQSAALAGGGPHRAVEYASYLPAPSSRFNPFAQ